MNRKLYLSIFALALTGLSLSAQTFVPQPGEIAYSLVQSSQDRPLHQVKEKRHTEFAVSFNVGGNSEIIE